MTAELPLAGDLSTNPAHTNHKPKFLIISLCSLKMGFLFSLEVLWKQEFSGHFPGFYKHCFNSWGFNLPSSFQQKFEVCEGWQRHSFPPLISEATQVKVVLSGHEWVKHGYKCLISTKNETSYYIINTCSALSDLINNSLFNINHLSNIFRYSYTRTLPSVGCILWIHHVRQKTQNYHLPLMPLCRPAPVTRLCYIKRTQCKRTQLCTGTQSRMTATFY